MSEPKPNIIVIALGPDCDCLDLERDPDRLGVRYCYADPFRGARFDPCHHGSVVRPLAVGDISADLAAEALGLTPDDMDSVGTTRERIDPFISAARRVREAREKRGAG